jgi:hypothetical protein
MLIKPKLDFLCLLYMHTYLGNRGCTVIVL